MPNYFELERISNKDLLESRTAKKVPVCICADASYSMAGDRIIHMNNGIRDFINSSRSNPDASDSIDLCIISFSGRGIRTVLDFTVVNSVKDFKDLVPDGDTPLGAAVSAALDKIDARLEQYRAQTIPSTLPRLIIMSDGEATDDTTEAVQRVQREQKAHRLKVQCIGLGDGSEREDLGKFTLDGVVESCDAVHIENFFTMLSGSVAELSTDVIGIDNMLY